MALSETDTVALRDSSLATEIDGEAVLMNVRDGRYYGLDTIAHDIWKRMAEPVTVAALVKGLVADYAGDPDRIRHDVLSLLDEFAAKYLIRVS